MFLEFVEAEQTQNIEARKFPYLPNCVFDACHTTYIYNKQPANENLFTFKWSFVPWNWLPSLGQS
jgi:hypothetical protein